MYQHEQAKPGGLSIEALGNGGRLGSMGGPKTPRQAPDTHVVMHSGVSLLYQLAIRTVSSSAIALFSLFQADLCRQT